MVEYKVSARTATTTCLTLWDPARCSHSAPKRAGMGGASAQGYNAPNHAEPNPPLVPPSIDVARGQTMAARDAAEADPRGEKGAN